MKFLVLLGILVGVKGQYDENKPFQGYEYSKGSGSSLSASIARFDTSSLISSKSDSEMVKKYYYVYAAPDEPEEIQTASVVNEFPPVKHYRIIFVKAPNYKPSQKNIISTEAKVEEKTIIYVLTKTPGEIEDIKLSPTEQTTPSKPEVLFIKYKSEQNINDKLGIQDVQKVWGGRVDVNEINKDLIAAGGLPGRTVSGYTQSSQRSENIDVIDKGPLIAVFPLSQNQNQDSTTKRYGLPKFK